MLVLFSIGKRLRSANILIVPLDTVILTNKIVLYSIEISV